MKSSTFKQARKFYDENATKLTSVLHNELRHEIDYQSEYDQVAVWFDDFSLCYQNSDMNGGGKGEPHWNNEGANDGLDKLKDILTADDRFNALIAEDEYWSDEYLNTFINDFCDDFAEKHDISDYFECNSD
jgi:hypothetical protein